MSVSPRLELPLLNSGQAQKEVTHNEALQYLDMAVAACVEEPPRSTPPTSPFVGTCYIVADAPTGAWAGRAHCLASFTSGGWRFISAVEGLTALVRTSGVTATYREGLWDLGTIKGTSIVVAGQQVVGARAAPIASPAGGSVVDTECRSTVSQILSMMRQHGLIASGS